VQTHAGFTELFHWLNRSQAMALRSKPSGIAACPRANLKDPSGLPGQEVQYVGENARR